MAEQAEVTRRGARSVDLFDVGSATVLVVILLAGSIYFGSVDSYSRWQMFFLGAMAAFLVFLMAWRDSKPR